jgi:PAS domain S-box-containing protein
MPLRRLALIAAFAGLLAHVAILYLFGDRSPGPLASNIIQFLLGLGATWACAAAARRSGNYGWKVWWLTAIALALYTVGQGIVIYYDNIIHAQLYSPWISDQFLFFWVIPLPMAALIDRWSRPKGVDWALTLDFSQAVLVALALHLSAFALNTLWQKNGQDMAYLEWEIRLIRDGLVLTALWSKVFLSSVPKTRSMFARIGLFFLAYSIADLFYLYAEASWGNRVGSYLDLFWSVPRIVLIAGALTWEDAPELASDPRPKRTRVQTLPLHLASILGPLIVALIALRIAAGAPVLAVVLVSLSFLFASIRFLITQDRQDVAIAELRSSRDLLEAVIEGSQEAIYVRDQEGRYLLANPAARQLLGTTESEIVGKTNQEYFTAEDAAWTRSSDLEVIRSNRPQTVEQTLTLKGTARFLVSNKAPYRDANGNVIGIVGIASDQTERLKMEAEVRKAQRMESVGTLAAGVAHDFNNLLTVIKGYSQLLLEEVAGTPSQDKVKQIDAASNKAASLTRQLLAFSRQQVLQPKIISLNTVVSDMQKMLQRLIGEDIDFKVQLAADVPSILADPGQMEQVIMNLAANARDAMPRGGKFTIQTQRVELDEEYSRQHLHAPPGTYVQLAVSDTGIGMDEATQSRIFEPFFTTKPAGKGTGLGLSTVYGITKQSGGYIWVYSEPGHGTTFKMYFPIAAVGAEATAAPKPLAKRQAGSETVLVVEDEPSLLALVQASLKKHGYQVLTASSGEEAEAVARQHAGAIHLLLTDVVMPQTSGREAAKRVLELRPEIRVIWMSGYPDDTIVHHGILEAGVHFLQKPFTPATLGEKVREVLDKT